VAVIRVDERTTASWRSVVADVRRALRDAGEQDPIDEAARKKQKK